MVQLAETYATKVKVSISLMIVESDVLFWIYSRLRSLAI